MKIGKLIKEKRKDLGISQRELGERIEKTGQYISYLENNNEANPSIDLLKDLAINMGLSLDELIKTKTKTNKKEYHADFNKILDLADDLFREVYNYSKNKEKLNLSANELINKEKYFLTDLANIFRDAIFTKLRQVEKRFKYHDNLPASEGIEFKFAPNGTRKDKDGGIVEFANNVDITKKLNDEKYLKHKIKQYEQYLDNVKKGKDNYEYEEKKREAAKVKLEKGTTGDNKKPKKANQEDIDKLMGR
ncbi:MAG: helix-turn-helix transcriptional regulator [Halanaerobiales bacterium]|nr:helix-turn-helix transcriptional regulator [Halanaerobiales bacterium]